jgi:predicted DCC family thiol-disulfide oxidoreductase YuxK
MGQINPVACPGAHPVTSSPPTATPPSRREDPTRADPVRDDAAQDEWLLVYDGGCPFCRHFAMSSELRGGLPNLRIVDGRADAGLRRSLLARGLPLAEGAVLLQGGQAWHGAAAVRQLCRLMRPSDSLLKVLVPLFDGQGRSARLYPVLLAARRLALALKGLPVDPDRT